MTFSDCKGGQNVIMTNDVRTLVFAASSENEDHLSSTRATTINITVMSIPI